MKIALTDDLIARARLGPTVKQAKLWDETIPGLGVLVGKRRKTFFVDCRDPLGMRRRRTLGYVGFMSLAEARERAAVLVGAQRGRPSASARLRQAEQRLEHAVRDWLIELAIAMARPAWQPRANESPARVNRRRKS